MAVQIDHIILPVNDAQASIVFYTQTLGFTHEGDDGPFAVMRVSPDFMLLLAAWGTKGGEHLAFAMPREEFDEVFRHLRDTGIPYGGRYDTVGSMTGPGEERGARGQGKALYFFDPDRHLVEIRHYEG